MKYNEPTLFGFLLFFAILAFAATLNLVKSSFESGQKDACKSVKMEWIKNAKKCMKVTIEEQP